MFLTTPSPGVLRAAGARAWLPIRGGAPPQPRWLSTTNMSAAAGHIISFNRSSTPELTQLLDTYRQMVILPTYLSVEQRRQIYKPKLQHILKNDPVTMEIDGVVHKFRYRSLVADVPSTRTTANQAIAMMTTPGDFKNIPPLLEGFVRAGRKLSSEFYGKIIRKLAMNDCLHIVVNCIKGVDRTGFKLNRSDLINALLVYMQRPAITSGWNEFKTKTALKDVRLILNILESDKDHAPKAAQAGAFPYYRDPQVLAARLHMAAARAVHHRGGKDEDGTVAKYAEELVTLWPENKGLLDLQPDDAYKKDGNMRYLLHRDAYLFYAAPVLNGLTLAAQVVDPGLAMQLQNRADMVDAEVSTALAAPERTRGGRGEAMYNALFNPQAAQVEQQEAAEVEEAA
ncbi:hypothetical protein C8A01DRAFT_15295 [Parachaetomium inaequale]|uniref:Uncharacterized protein n=1 Tax=Parachaetomium inaequale TaxID=2588326 RepID=A0AAN6PKQ5_9PEZI|nr:hypothetical protein C8A01DRAFT_15295 [Parachaetomium inaequale]